MAHRLDPLVNPTSIAIVGASRRAGSVGNSAIRNLLEGGYERPLFAINPGYDEVEGVACYPSLDELPERVQHVVFAVGDERIEAAFEDAIAHGARACTIFSALILEQDRNLSQRIKARAEAAGILLAGGNGMGFYNFSGGVRVCAFETRRHDRPGNVALLSQSGSGLAGILDVDERLDFCFATSSGQELVVSMEDYLDYVLDLPELRVVGLFMETSRRPADLRGALEKARAREIPVVALKVGRTGRAADLALSHSGALSGSDSAYQALFDRYGVQRVADMDELATALIMFAQPHPVSAGGLVTLHDSGGEQQLLVDLADRFGVTLTELGEDSSARLAAILDPGLAAINPLDGWSAGGPGADRTMEDGFTILINDPGAALGAVIHDRAPFGELVPAYREYLDKAHSASGKPVFLVANRQGVGGDERAVQWTREGYPVLDGVASFLVGARALFAYRDFLAWDRSCGEDALPSVPDDVLAGWREALNTDRALDGHRSERLLADVGIPMVESVVVENRAQLEELAGGFADSAVLKTAMPGVAHKSDVGGVRLNLGCAADMLSAYDDLALRLGPRVLLAPMFDGPGIEMILGIARDAQFGPLIVMGFGGIHTEIVQDVALALPPFGPATARRCIDRLTLRPLLDGVRGAPALDSAAYCDAAARLSVLAVELADLIVEVDINPVKVLPKGCLGLDALVVCSKARRQ